MSWAAISRIDPLEFESGAMKSIARYLADRHNKASGEAWPSNATIQRETGFSRSAVIGCVNLLAEAGLISITKSGGGRKGDTRRLTFDLTTPARVIQSRLRTAEHRLRERRAAYRKNGSNPSPPYMFQMRLIPS